jgi:endoglucanase
LPPLDAEAVRASVLAAADAYLETQAAQPFGHPYAPPEGIYDWGSTHLVLQNALVLAAAYDLSGDEKYRSGALEAMDYVLGRNALNLSYVTGYGTVFSQNQHSRWFAHQANADLPHPPKGSLAGGPNSSIQDPVAQALFAAKGCAPQMCYVDDIESWSTNEITINWNAALSQMAGWLAVHGPLPGG